MLYAIVNLTEADVAFIRHEMSTRCEAPEGADLENIVRSLQYPIRQNEDLEDEIRALAIVNEEVT